ncbi:MULTISPECIES: hypothetical protein [Vibrio]|uniref:hypothetical protein n=1 Tax=Vibrio TaxID=662 RepID=UPI0004D8DDC5|nr:MULTISPECIES: hypothetical protein [Vibrio]MBY8119451.1 hypothetical protein [Vibrio fluvialis]EHK2852595.1 hypothetical protein [Vibrio parahaemolyticus]EJG1863490.1 hypothetical protein [Vibrio parahaemolyticus]EJG2212942.1 hypothetical protein [Vibrio parahaemolyticus]ELA9313254.1 hypothetical protein [Vibrio parahaemolyticus]
MCYGCYEPEEINWFLQLSKRLSSAMGMSCTEDYHPYQGACAYVTLYKKAQLLDVSYHAQRPNGPDILSFPVGDIEHLRAIVFQIIKLGFQRLHWINSEEVEEMCPLPSPGLERLNFYLAFMNYGDGKCETNRYLRAEISSLVDRGTTSPDTSTAMLLPAIPTAGDKL